MLNCTAEALQNYLKGHGYSVVKWPREDIQPLLLLEMTSDDALKEFGNIVDIFEEQPAALPAIKQRKASNMSGAQSGNLEVGLGLKLSGVFDWFKMKALGGSVGYDKASTLRFQFADVTVKSVLPLDLDTFIRRAGTVSSLPKVREFLKAEKIFAITDVLYAQSVIIDGEDSNGGKAEIDLPGIQGIVDAKASIKLSSGSSSRIELTSATPLAFGIKAVQLFRVGSELSTRFVAPDEMQLEGIALVEPEPQPIYLDLDAIFAG